MLFSIQFVPRLSSEDHWEKLDSHELEFDSPMLEFGVRGYSLQLHR